ncbi:MAG: hypothetical protein LBV80_00580 [Deltaproteobacteria bacterium]|jgi:hypothetical protein|nr:hypothetical protein [Deltaproteobacteria bacterium]
MNTNAALSFKDIAELTRDEKREIWMKRTRHTIAFLASVVGVAPNVLSRYLRSSDMPAAHHAKLVAYGVPEEILPAPVQKSLGRPPVTPISFHSPIEQ